MASLAPYSITLGGTDYPAKYAALLAYLEPYLTNLETFTFSGGNVGIGTITPTARFQVVSTGQTVVRLKGGSASGQSAALYIERAGAATTLGAFGDSASILGGTVDQAVAVYADSGVPITFNQSTAERARIDTNGNLLLGVTSFGTAGRVTAQSASANGNFVSNNTAGSGTRYHCVFYENGTERGSVTSNGSTTSYVTSSDYRLKEDIASMTGALAKVAALKPVTYKWKSTGEAGEGFIAHELAEVCPDAVIGEKDALNEDGSIKAQGIDTSFLVATLTAAIKEQQALINDLRARVAALEAA